MLTAVAADISCHTRWTQIPQLPILGCAEGRGHPHGAEAEHAQGTRTRRHERPNPQSQFPNTSGATREAQHCAALAGEADAEDTAEMTGEGPLAWALVPAFV